jgi:predicted dehydrogenase
MIAVCTKHQVKLAIAHQTRYSPRLTVVRGLIQAGKLGKVLEIRTRGKEDQRGGGEDLWVLGCHMFNLMCFYGGKPLWCFGSVEQEGHPIRAADVKPGAEGIGPLAGDRVHALYRLEGGAMGHFDSVRAAGGKPTRFGIQIIGSAGIVQSFDTGHLPEMHFLPDSSWGSVRAGKKWLPISSAGVDKPEPLENRGLHGGNLLAVKDLIEAVERDRQPLCSIYDARAATEMIVAVFESQRLGRPVPFPLTTRENPLTLLQ